MPYIEHALGRTWYTVRGSRAKNIPLIALHGGPGSGHSSMLPYLDLSHSRQVILYDQLGCGRSGLTDKKRWTVATFVRELDLLLKAWGITEFHLLGTSWGGTLALEYHLRKHPGGLKTLTLQSPMVSALDWQRDANKLLKALPDKTRKVIRYCHEIGATDSRVYAQAMFEFYSRHVLRNKLELRKKNPRSKGGQQIYEHMWGPSEFQVTGTLKNFDRTRELSSVNVPTLFVCGEYDESTPRSARKYQSRIKNARLEVVKNASHVIAKERPAVLKRIVGRFLEQNDG
jgi:proline iminopeptidase